MTIPGVDYAWSHPGGAALKAAGYRFACRYLSHDMAKNITRKEADDLAEHGVSVVSVWETTARRALAGKSAGHLDAAGALTQATAAGMPDGRPVFFAVDFDARPDQQDEINDYLHGAADVLGVERVGIYGGYWPVTRALDAHRARWAWQTVAWSGSHWDPRAHIRQTGGVRVNGVSCDLDTAMVVDFGQWMPGKSPVKPVTVPHHPSPAPVPVPHVRKWHTVHSGDTLDGIARKYHIRGGWPQLQQWNHLRDPDHIIPGQKIYLEP